MRRILALLLTCTLVVLGLHVAGVQPAAGLDQFTVGPASLMPSASFDQPQIFWGWVRAIAAAVSAFAAFWCLEDRWGCD